MPLKMIPRRDRKLNRLVKAAEPERVRKGTAVYRRGDDADAVYLVLEGHVRLMVRRRGARRDESVAVVGPWEFFGEEALAEESRRRYTATAGQGCVLLAIPGKRMLKALRGSPKTLATFVDALSADQARWLRTCGAPSKARIADVLIDLTERFGVEEGRKITIGHWFTHQELADLAGVHRSTVTTTLNEWIYEGVLKESQKRLVVARLAALRKAGSEPSR